jgi:UDP-glucose 4-epimerase
MNLLITGGAGYIGSHTARALRAAKHKVVIIDNLSSGHRAAVSDFECIKGDLGNKQDLEAIFSKYPFDAVIHFAGSIEAGESISDPKRFFDNNIICGLNLLEAMLTHDVKRIVFSSTAAVYGEPGKMPIEEKDATVPSNVYGLTKLMFERALEAYDVAYGLKSVRLRYFNAAGADPSGEIGEDHPRESHLIPLCLQVALGKRDHIKIFGTDYPTPDGTGIRDYVHVCDLADAHVLALSFLEKNVVSEVFNLGNENGVSVREIIETVKRVTGSDIPVIEEIRREGDAALLFASAQKAKRVLGWKPKYPDIDQIVSTAWNWHNTHPDGYITTSDSAT